MACVSECEGVVPDGVRLTLVCSYDANLDEYEKGTTAAVAAVLLRLEDKVGVSSWGCPARHACLVRSMFPCVIVLLLFVALCLCFPAVPRR